MKLLKLSFLLLILLVSESSLFAGRGNPIMVIELDCREPAVTRNEINVREISTIPCDEETYPENNGCPPNYIAVGECDCVPDCPSLFPDCPDCEVVYWVTDLNANSETVGFCGCEPEGPAFCGCPPWLTKIPPDMTITFDTLCDIPDEPCYNGEIMVLPYENNCDNLDENGMDTLDIVIMLDIRIPSDPVTGYGYSVSIAQLFNCELTNDQNFVIALAEQYDNDAAFVDDDNDGKIELQFLRDPTMETVIDFNNENNPNAEDIVIPACALPAIPTLSTWMIIALGLIMAISGLLFVKRKEVRKAISTMMLSF